MISANVRDMIPKIQTFMKDQPINKAWLFGSCSRGEDTSDSDVDILVQYSKDEQVTLFTISRIMCSLKKLLNREVDLVEDEGLLPFAVDSVNRDKILIYERKSNGNRTQVRKRCGSVFGRTGTELRDFSWTL